MNEDTLKDEVKNFSVDVEENSKVELEDPNEFIEVKVERNVVRLLFEGKFEENTEEILENLDKFPKPEIKVEEVTSEKAYVSNPDNSMERSSIESQIDDDLDKNHDEGQEDILEDDTKAKNPVADGTDMMSKNLSLSPKLSLLETFQQN